MATGATEARTEDWNELLEQLVREATAPHNERRDSMRIPFFREIRLLSEDGAVDYGSGFSRDLTPKGLGVMHQASIPDEFIRIKVETASGLVECRGRLVWSRCIGEGWFFSGCELANG